MAANASPISTKPGTSPRLPRLVGCSKKTLRRLLWLFLSIRLRLRCHFLLSFLDTSFLQPSAALAQSQPHIGAPRSKGTLIIPRRYPVEQPTIFVLLFSTRPPASRKIGICCHNIPGHNGGSDNPPFDCALGLPRPKLQARSLGYSL